ncbi:MAG: helix-turn-helix domain-containing protein [Nitrospinota bacterium]
MDEHTAEARLEPELLVGMLMNAPRAGEQPEIATTGSMSLFLEPKGGPGPPSAEKGWPGWDHLGIFLQAAGAAGHPVPDRFIFSAGQVFYRDRRLEEVRLSGFVPPGGPDAGGRASLTPWTTPTPPRLTAGPNGALVLDPADRGRTHLSALAVKGREVAFSWDLRADASETGGIASDAPRGPGLISPLLEVDNSLLYHKFRGVLAAGEFSTPEGEKWPAADLTSDRRTVRAVAQLKPDPVEVEPYLASPELAEWQDRMTRNVMAMDDQTADVLDIISAVWLRQADHPEAMANVTADDFLRCRGLLPKKSGTGRRGGYEEDQRKEIARHIGILSSTWITVAEMEVTEQAEGKKGPYRRRTKWRGESRAVVVTGRLGQVDTSGKLEVHSWRARPGDVFSKFLFGPGRQTALLSQKALEYHPVNQRWEKRLTRYLAWQWRNRQGGGTYLVPFAVETLLEAAKETVDPKHPIRTTERLEKALDTLLRDGVIAGWQYEAADEEIVGQRGWWKGWLTWKVLIEPPQKTMDQYAKIKMPEPSRPRALPAGELDPATLRQARQERGLTQMQAAEEIGINQATLSRIERGTRPDPGTLAKIRRWLAGEA